MSLNLEQDEIIRINNTQLENVQYVKVLGVIDQVNWKWNRHVNEINQQMLQKLYICSHLNK